MKITLNNIQDIYKSKLVDVDTMELRGYRLIKELFVDSSGFGGPEEPALTQNQFTSELTDLLKEHGSLYATITNSGQFQVYVGLFKKEGKSKSKKIGNNTYRIDYETSEAIRLHNTDILIFEADHVTLNSGGWQTVTTKARMNQYLPAEVRISQENFEWFVNDSRDGSKKPFVDGMIIAA
jgi:hypothetical protein